MSRYRPGGRPRRPGRRPSDRRSSRLRSSTSTEPRGFSAPVLRPIFSLLPFKGPEKRLELNHLSHSLVLGAAIGGAYSGYAFAGPSGALIGLAFGYVTLSLYVETGRYYRH